MEIRNTLRVFFTSFERNHDFWPMGGRISLQPLLSVPNRNLILKTAQARVLERRDLVSLHLPVRRGFWFPSRAIDSGEPQFQLLPGPEVERSPGENTIEEPYPHFVDIRGGQGDLVAAVLIDMRLVFSAGPRKHQPGC